MSSVANFCIQTISPRQFQWSGRLFLSIPHPRGPAPIPPSLPRRSALETAFPKSRTRTNQAHEKQPGRGSGSPSRYPLWRGRFQAIFHTPPALQASIRQIQPVPHLCAETLGLAGVYEETGTGKAGCVVEGAEGLQFVLHVLGRFGFWLVGSSTGCDTGGAFCFSGSVCC
jgi:hypothetical protein